MEEITDSTGKKIPVFQVKRVLGGPHSGLRPYGPNSRISEGPFHNEVEMKDGTILLLKDCPDQETAYAENRRLRRIVEGA